MPDRSSRLRETLWIALVLMAAALYVRVAHLRLESLMHDEVFSTRVALADSPQAMRMIVQDLVHPPLYYFLLKASLRLQRAVVDPTPLQLRVLSLAAGVLTIPLLLLLGLRIPALRWPSVLAAALLAVSPDHILFSQEVRSYALTCLLVAVLLLWSAWFERYADRALYWVVGAALMTIYAYVHYFAVIYSLAILLPIAISPVTRRYRLRAAAAASFAAIAFLPWIVKEAPVYRRKSGLSHNLAWSSPPSITQLLRSFSDFIAVPKHGGFSLLYLLMVLPLFYFALRSARPGERAPLPPRIKHTLALVAFMPPMLVFLLSSRPLKMPIYADRQFLPSILGFLLLLAYGLRQVVLRFAGDRRRLVLAGGVVALIGVPVDALIAQGHHPSRVPMAPLAQEIALHPELPVFASRSTIGDPLDYQLHGSRKVNELPSDLSLLPDEFILVDLPANSQQTPPMKAILDQSDVLQQQSFYGWNSTYGAIFRIVRKR